MTITIIFGQTAVDRYLDNDPSYVRGGHEEEFVFETSGEVDAFLLGLRSMDGWQAFCVKNGEVR